MASPKVEAVRGLEYVRLGTLLGRKLTARHIMAAVPRMAAAYRPGMSREQFGSALAKQNAKAAWLPFLLQLLTVIWPIIEKLWGGA
jgi:hypothetical protein